MEGNAKQEPLTVFLAKAVEEIRKAVAPMGGAILPEIEMTTWHASPGFKISVKFQEAALPEYFKQGKARTLQALKDIASSWGID